MQEASSGYDRPLNETVMLFTYVFGIIAPAGKGIRWPLMRHSGLCDTLNGASTMRTVTPLGSVKVATVSADASVAEKSLQAITASSSCLLVIACTAPNSIYPDLGYLITLFCVSGSPSARG